MGSKLPTLVQGLEAAVAQGGLFIDGLELIVEKNSSLVCRPPLLFLSAAAGWKVHS